MADNVLNQILLENWIPVISWHHIEELIRHRDEAVAENRMQFLLALPQVAWIWCANGLDFIGSVVDVQAAEIQVYLSAECDSVKKRLLATRDRLLRFGVLSKILALSLWRNLRPYAIGMGKNQQKIALICHSKSNVNDDTPLSALKVKKDFIF
jgi:hypothetical protein